MCLYVFEEEWGKHPQLLQDLDLGWPSAQKKLAENWSSHLLKDNVEEVPYTVVNLCGALESCNYVGQGPGVVWLCDCLAFVLS